MQGRLCLNKFIIPIIVIILFCITFATSSNPALALDEWLTQRNILRKSLSHQFSRGVLSLTAKELIKRGEILAEIPEDAVLTPGSFDGHPVLSTYVT